MIRKDALKITKENLIPVIKTKYCLDGYKINPIEAHEWGRNLVYTCEKTANDSKILRITFLNDRNRELILAEVEYVRYLFDNGGSVANVISSRKGNLMEEIIYNNQSYFICLFEKAKGKMLVENGYRYREGVPLTEYYYNCGKVLGKMHQLSKEYIPNNCRYSYFDKFNTKYIDKLVPDSLSLLKEKMFQILNELKGLDKTIFNYGMVHFDYNDGNYSIDFDTGQITVYDFDDSCFGFYMYDLADLWTHGVGWIQFEKDSNKRKKFMEDYFCTVLEGYRSETELDNDMLAKLPLFINATLMENILGAFEEMKNDTEEFDLIEWLSYRIKCLEDDLVYVGFFDDIYSSEEPFEYEERDIYL